MLSGINMGWAELLLPNVNSTTNIQHHNVCSDDKAALLKWIKLQRVLLCFPVAVMGGGGKNETK